MVAFHPSLPSTFVQPFPTNNPVQAKIYLGYNDPGAPPAMTTQFRVRPFLSQLQGGIELECPGPKQGLESCRVAPW